MIKVSSNEKVGVTQYKPIYGNYNNKLIQRKAVGKFVKKSNGFFQLSHLKNRKTNFNKIIFWFRFGEITGKHICYF